MKRKNTIIIILITAIVTCLITNTVRDTLYVANNGRIISKLSDVTRIIRKYSIYKPDDDTLSDAASEALTASIGDRYTRYMPKEEYQAYIEELSSAYLGVGITLMADIIDNTVTISKINEDGPTADADILVGDILLEVDDNKCTAETMPEIIKLIRSKQEGDTATFLIKRDGVEKEVVIPIRHIYKKLVTGEMLQDGIGYVKIDAFTGDMLNGTRTAYDDFVDTITQLSDSGMEKMIIDLRDNPGGEFNVVMSICDEIMSEGMITYTEDKDGKQEKYFAKAGGLDYPIVIITNSGSASASEVLTSALKDNGLATVVGEKTYGKGVVQTYFQLSDGSGLSVTSARYFTPDGVCIDGIGIEPDTTCTLGEGKTMADYTPENDPQILCAVAELNKR